MPNKKEDALLKELKRIRELNCSLKRQLKQLTPVTENFKMSTLLEILSGSLSYDSSWAIYAERVDGEFKPESPARFGQRIFENGGLLDDCEFFMTNEQVCDRRSEWFGTFLEELREMPQIQDWEAAYEQANDDVEWCDSVYSNSTKREAVVEWVEKTHPDWYESAQKEWESANDAEEVAYNLIDEVNESSAVAV